MNWIVELRSHLAKHASPAIAGIALFVLTCILTCAVWLPTARAATADSREQFAAAVRMRTMLEGYLEKDRSASDYKRTIDAYQKVYADSPDSDEATAALIAVAELYEEMGRLYDGKYFDTSIKTYLNLINNYPDSRYCSSALFGIAEIQDYDQKQLPNAQAAFQDFLKKYPHSEHADEARKALKEIVAAETPAKHGATIASQPPAASIAGAVAATAPNTGAAQPMAMVVSDDPAVAGQVVAPHEADGHISSVKGLQTENGRDTARIIIALDGTIDFQSARIASPDRIYFNISRATLASKGGDTDFNAQDGLVRAVRTAQNKPDVVRIVVDAPSAKDYDAYLLAKPYRLVIELSSQPGTLHAPAPSTAMAPAVAAPAVTKSAPVAPAVADTTEPTQAKERPVSLSRPADVPTIGTPTAPKPIGEGDTSLTRALGLKIHRIVIDAGHGGHDTGTIGPHGLLEKDLCLDVALRLGKEIEQKLPGAEVVYTRQDDTFIPLEERTRIANDAKADLFISIHANSSHDETARGVETYYLNFSTSPDSMEVAARENAFSQESIHDLQDVIKKIARNDKIEESKELAGDVQESLSHKLAASSPAVRDRGVKQAPFVVLIGADMPSILAEISFVSNPTDEKLLKATSRRQQIADGLFRGITTYLDSLNSLSDNKQKSADAGAASADNRLEARNANSGVSPK